MCLADKIKDKITDKIKDKIKEIFKNNYEIFEGQKSDNRINIGKQKYFEFGDLRIEHPKCQIIIEIETGGGVTNLIKYFYLLSKPELKEKIGCKKIILFHIYIQQTDNDYSTHLELWNFINEKIVCFSIEDKLHPYLIPIKSSEDFNNIINAIIRTLKLHNVDV